jgi:hypothetical protein
MGPTTLGQNRINNYRASAKPDGLLAVVGAAKIDWDAIDPIAGQNEIGVITIGSAPSGNNFKLTFGGQQTADIADTATAATVEEALEGLSTIGNGNVNVSGEAGGPYTVEFVGDLAKTNVGAITTDDAGVTYAVSQAGAADADESLPGGVTAKIGYKVLRAGTIIVKDGSTYRPATDEDTLVRGETFIVDGHIFKDLNDEGGHLGEVYEAGTFFAARLLIGGTGQVTEEDFLAAFPNVRLVR